MSDEKTGETPERITREQVVAAYGQFVEAGILSPFSVPGTLEGNEADRLYYAWVKQGDLEAGENDELQRLHDLDKTMIRIDAGFTGFHFMEDVRGWLMQDAENSTAIEDAETKARIRLLIAQALRKVNALLREKTKQ